MDPIIRLAIVGARGRMGQISVQHFASITDCEVVSHVHSDQDLAQALKESKANVAVDFTVAGLGHIHARTILDAGMHAVIGTSGVDPQADRELDPLAKKHGLGCRIVPNFSLGSVVQQRLARQLASLFPAVSIKEEHGPHKKDSPSGTALETARQIENALRASGTSEFAAEPVPIESHRIPGVIANQTVHFAGNSETLSLVHQISDRSAYGAGVYLAVRSLFKRPGCVRGLEDLVFSRMDP